MSKSWLFPLAGALLFAGAPAARADVNASPNLPQAIDGNPDPAVFETTLVAREVPLTLPNGPHVENAITFNGTIPGPEIRVKVGDTVIVHYRSELPAADGNTSIHWHGIELNDFSDGTAITQDPLAPVSPKVRNPLIPSGGSYTYTFKVPRAGIFWYHPHVSPLNPVFRGQYGSLVVTSPADEQLQRLGVLPRAAQTKTLVLADTTVCTAPGTNDGFTFGPRLPWAGDLDGDGVRDPFPGKFEADDLSPLQACEGAGRSDVEGDLTPGAAPLAAGDIPNLPVGYAGDGRQVLVNGAVPYDRANPPDAGAGAPGTVPFGAETLRVTPGEGVRLQLIDAAISRYFRLQLSDRRGALVPLFRVGGEGGLLRRVRVEGLAARAPRFAGGQLPQYDRGEILVAPGQRADVVLRVPRDALPGDVLTIWTRDFQRGGNGHNGYDLLPTTAVLHLRVMAGAPSTYVISEGEPLLDDPRVNAPAEDLRGLPVANLLSPASVNQPRGSTSPAIHLTFNSGHADVDGIPAMLDNNTAGIPFQKVMRPATVRFAQAGRVLQLEVDNDTDLSHPFHLHGFSFQPIALLAKASGAVLRSFPEPEQVDTFEIPARDALVMRLRLDDRPQPGGAAGGVAGRWVFHCHIFGHAVDGMMSELDAVLAPGPKSFRLARDGRITMVLRKRRAVVLQVVRAHGSLVGRVRLGTHPAGRSHARWPLRVHGRRLRPGRYLVSLHALDSGTLSAPAAPGRRVLVVRE